MSRRWNALGAFRAVWGQVARSARGVAGRLGSFCPRGTPRRRPPGKSGWGLDNGVYSGIIVLKYQIGRPAMNSVLRISEAASLAMHTTVLLAAHPDRLVCTREAASVLDVSEAHLAKVLQRLVKQGLVRSARGPKGGFALSKPAEEISLLNVYESIEGRLENAACLLGRPVCRGERCILGGLLATVNAQVREYLGSTKLPELTTVYG